MHGCVCLWSHRRVGVVSTQYAAAVPAPRRTSGRDMSPPPLAPPPPPARRAAATSSSSSTSSIVQPPLYLRRRHGRRHGRRVGTGGGEGGSTALQPGGWGRPPRPCPPRPRAPPLLPAYPREASSRVRAEGPSPGSPRLFSQPPTPAPGQPHPRESASSRAPGPCWRAWAVGARPGRLTPSAPAIAAHHRGPPLPPPTTARPRALPFPAPKPVRPSHPRPLPSPPKFLVPTRTVSWVLPCWRAPWPLRAPRTHAFHTHAFQPTPSQPRPRTQALARTPSHPRLCAHAFAPTP